MEFRILGPLEVIGPRGPVEVAGTRRRALLTRLVLAANETVSVDQLIEDTWRGNPPRQAVKSLQMQVAHLRRAFEEAGIAAAEVLVTRPAGYRIVVDDDAVDGRRFERLVREGRAAVAAGSHEAGRDLLCRALALWRGRVLAEVEGEPFAHGEVARLDELRLTAVEERIDADLALGSHHEVIPELETAVDAFPLRERLWGQLMVAYYRGQRQADALRAYQRARAALAELGVEPTLRLRDLEHAVLAQDTALDWAPPATRHAPAGGAGGEGGSLLAGAGSAWEQGAFADEPPRAHGLPRHLTAFVGRRAELHQLTTTLSSTRLLTLTGGGGCGKTRLAVELVQRTVADHRHGAWFVDLSRVRQPELVAGTVATALRLADRQATTPDALGDQLVDAEALIVLDNCEHVVEACAELVESLLLRCPSLTALVTSRERLGVLGETVWRVPSLSLPPGLGAVPLTELARSEAVELFVDRARALVGDLSLADTGAANAVARICRRLDGIPLAVELAAALLPNLPVDEIARHLEVRLDLLDLPRRGAVPRQRTMQATIDWSYELLDEDERRTFERLSVLVGEFSLPIAEAIASLPECPVDVTRALNGLVTKSIVQVVLGPLGAERYRLLEPLRQYGAGKLAASDHADAVQRAHAMHFADLAERVDRNIHGPQAADWLREAERELPNFRAALQWCFGEGELELFLRLAGSLRWFFGRMGHLAEARRWLELVLERRDQLPPSLLLLAVTARSTVAYSEGDFATTMAIAEEGVTLARRVHDRQQLAVALIVRGASAVYEGHLERAFECFEEADGLCRELGDEWGRAWLLSCWAVASRRSGDPVRCQRQLLECLTIFERLGDDHGRILPLVNLALAAVQLGQLEQGVGHAEEALAVANRIGDRQCTHVAACTLGRIELERGRLDVARRHLLHGIRGFKGAENRLAVTMALDGLAFLALIRERYEASAAVIAFTDGLREEIAAPLASEREAERARALAEIEEHLGRLRTEAAMAWGGSMALDDAIREATAGSAPPDQDAPAGGGIDLDREHRASSLGTGA